MTRMNKCTVLLPSGWLSILSTHCPHQEDVAWHQYFSHWQRRYVRISLNGSIQREPRAGSVFFSYFKKNSKHLNLKSKWKQKQFAVSGRLKPQNTEWKLLRVKVIISVFFFNINDNILELLKWLSVLSHPLDTKKHNLVKPFSIELEDCAVTNVLFFCSYHNECS